MKTITLKTTTKDGITVVKDGRTVLAKVYESKGFWAVQSNGMVNYKDTMDNALALVAERRADRANAFGGDTEVVFA